MKNHGGVTTSAKYVAYIAVMTALLIGAQYALSFVAGIEIVTALLLCFSAYFGVVCGMLTALSFSLLRCFIWGIYPPVLILYLIYYPLFALIFGMLGKIKDEAFSRGKMSIAATVNVILIALAALCLCLAIFDVIKISRLYRATVTACLYAIAGVCIAACIAFNAVFISVRRGKLAGGKTLKLFLLTAVAAVCTVCFTLLDDVISPLMLGMDGVGALSYFYASFTAMLPQVICTLATVPVLYFPVMFALTKACPKR